jgi:hypothetical protein
VSWFDTKMRRTARRSRVTSVKGGDAQVMRPLGHDHFGEFQTGNNGSAEEYRDDSGNDEG